MRGKCIAYALACVVFGAPLPLWAQATTGRSGPLAKARQTPTTRVGAGSSPAGSDGALLARFGISAAERLATADNPEERLRGIERLAGRRERAAIERLVQLLEPDPFAPDNGKAALVALRGMAGFVGNENVLRVLGKLATTDGGHGPLEGVVRETAALVLAESGEPKALEVLYKAAGERGAAAMAARRALVAHPPASFWSGWKSRERLSVAACELFAELGDLRAIPVLRDVLLAAPSAATSAKTADEDVEAGGDSSALAKALGEPNRAAEHEVLADDAGRVAAALALARLGEQVQVPVARGWTKTSSPETRRQGWMVLLASGAPEVSPALVELLGAPEADEAAIELAPHARSADLVARIEAKLAALAPATSAPAPASASASPSAPAPASASASPSAPASASVPASTPNGVGHDGWLRRGARDGTVAAALIATIGRIDNAAAWQSLGRMLSHPQWASHAARVLALADGDGPRRALEQALSRPESCRVAARAAALRARIFGESVQGLPRVLAVLWRSSDPADRAAAAFGFALADSPAPDGASVWASRDPVVVRAAAKVLLVASPAAVMQAAHRLSTESDPTSRIALALSLAARPEAADVISTDQLVLWALERSPLSPLSAVVLGLRERRETEGRLEDLLGDRSPVLRAHAAMGLAGSPCADSSARLARRWQFEPDAEVRRALVRALAARSEPQRVLPLKWAARLDPDADARELARAGLAGIPLEPPWPTMARCTGQSGRRARDLIWTFADLDREQTARSEVRGTAAANAARPDASGTAGTPAMPHLGETPKSDQAAEESKVRAGWVIDAWGLALPVSPDPDGTVIVPGARAPARGGAFELASWLPADNASAHDGPQREPEPRSKREKH